MHTWRQAFFFFVAIKRVVIFYKYPGIKTSKRYSFRLPCISFKRFKMADTFEIMFDLFLQNRSKCFHSRIVNLYHEKNDACVVEHINQGIYCKMHAHHKSKYNSFKNGNEHTYSFITLPPIFLQYFLLRMRQVMTFSSSSWCSGQLLINEDTV